MRSLRVLLVQVRDPDDPMAAHERACVERRFGTRRVDLHTVNALATTVTPAVLEGYDAVVFGGSGAYSVHDPRSEPWVSDLHRVLERALARRMPGFGLCFGHQLLGAHLGTDVVTDERHAELGTVDVQLTAAGTDDPVFSVLEPDFHAHTGHSDHVTALPRGAKLLAGNDRLSTQAFRVADAPFYSTQFHPDLTGAEAVSRWLAYQDSLPPAERDAEVGTASHFRPGADAATLLLGRFIDLLSRDELE